MFNADMTPEKVAEILKHQPDARIGVEIGTGNVFDAGQPKALTASAKTIETTRGLVFKYSAADRSYHLRGNPDTNMVFLHESLGGH